MRSRIYFLLQEVALHEMYFYLRYGQAQYLYEKLPNVAYLQRSSG